MITVKIGRVWESLVYLMRDVEMTFAVCTTPVEIGSLEGSVSGQQDSGCLSGVRAQL